MRTSLPLETRWDHPPLARGLASAAIGPGIGGETACRLPQNDLDDRQTRMFRLVENEARDVLGRGVVVHDKHTFTPVAENRQERVGGREKHRVIEVFVDPALNLLLDV